MPATSPAQLGADNVIRFVDLPHFLEELAGNLGRGRAFVRTRRKFELRSTIDVSIEAPSIDSRVEARGLIVFNRDGFLGLEFENFERDVLPELDALGEAADRLMHSSAGENTVVAALPHLQPAIEDEDGGDAQASAEPEPPTARGAFDEGRAPPRMPPARGPTIPAAPPPARARRRPILTEDLLNREEPAAESNPLPRRRRPLVDDLQAPALLDGEPPTADESERLDEADPSLVAFDDISAAPTIEGLAPMGLRGRAVEALGAQTADELSDGRWVLPRATASGVLRMTDPIDLLGLYLSALRHGTLTVYQGPEAEPGETVALEVSAQRTVTLTGTVVARIGPWLTLSIEDAEPVRQLLSEARGEWLPALSFLKSPPGPTSEGEYVEVNPARIDRIGTGRDRPNESDLATADADRSSSASGRSMDPFPASAGDPSTPERLDHLSASTSRISIPVDGPPGPDERSDDRAEGSESTGDLIDAIVSASQLQQTVPATQDSPLLAASPGTVGIVDVETGADEASAGVGPPPGPSQSALETSVLASTTEVADLPVDAREVHSADTAEPTPDLSLPDDDDDDEHPPSRSDAETVATAPDSDPREVPDTGPPPNDIADDDAPRVPQPPRLEGDVVVFDHKADLMQELTANLKNGGLFVASEPLPIRSKRRLMVRVGRDPLPIHLETDVVFADQGRIGFSVANVATAQRDLQRYLDGELPLAEDEASISPAPPPQTGGLATTDVETLNRDAASSQDVQSFSGVLTPPPKSDRLTSLQADRIEDPAELSSVSTLHLFEYIFRQQWKGVLTLKSGPQLRRVWMHEGSVAYVESEPFEEATGLGRILVSMKKVTEVQLREGLENSKQTSRTLGRSLVLLGALKRTDVTAGLREQVRIKMDSAFQWTEGRYEWTPWTEPPGQADLVLTRGVGVLASHVRSRLEHLNIAQLEQLFGSGLGRRAAHAEDVDTLATSLSLSPRDLRFLQLQIDGTKTVSDAVLGSPIGRLASLRLIALGLAMGFVRYTDQAAPAPARAPSRSDGASQGDRELKRHLTESVKLLRSQNHFEKLGVHWSAHHRTYRAAYEQAVQEFDLTKPPLRDASDELKSLARQARTELEKAFNALHDDQQRAQYRKTLFDKTEREYASDMLVKQGEVALMRGDRLKAIECLETAVELSATQRNRTLLMSAREGRS